MEFTLEELTSQGFRKVRLSDGTYYGYNPSRDGILLAKRIIDDRYSMHSVEKNGRFYHEEDYNFEQFEDFALQDFFDFIKCLERPTVGV